MRPFAVRIPPYMSDIQPKSSQSAAVAPPLASGESFPSPNTETPYLGPPDFANGADPELTLQAVAGGNPEPAAMLEPEDGTWLTGNGPLPRSHRERPRLPVGKLTLAIGCTGAGLAVVFEGISRLTQ